MNKLNDYLESLQNTNVEKRKEIEKLLCALKEWALNEELYAKGMERISNHSGLSVSPNSFFEQLRIFTHTLSSKAKTFSDNLSNLIINNFKEFLSTQSYAVKGNYTEGKKLSEYMVKKYKRANIAMEKYHISCRDCEQAAFDLDKEPSSSKKEKILQKFQVLKKDMDSNMENYKTLTNSYNRAIEKCDKTLEKIIESYNTIEENRCKHFDSSLKVLIEIVLKKVEASAFPSSMFYEQILPIKADIFDIVLEEMVVDTYEGVHPLFQGTGDGFHISVLETSGVSTGTKIAVEEIYKKEIDIIVKKAWDGESLTSEDYVKFNMRLKEPLGRKAWSWCMNLRRSNGIFKISDKGFGTIVELMLAALNECERTEDISIAKSCIILSQTFYKESLKGKVFLQSCILEHSLWKKMDFWESIVNSAIFEELKKQGVENYEDLSHEKNLVFCQLVSFGNIMMSFKISVERAKTLMEKYAQRYAFSDEETEGIMHAVNDSLDLTQ